MDYPSTIIEPLFVALTSALAGARALLLIHCTCDTAVIFLFSVLVLYRAGVCHSYIPGTRSIVYHEIMSFSATPANVLADRR